LSIGSVGGRDDNTVSNVKFLNNKVTNSQNGLRIKTVYGATGKVSGVTYSGNVLSGISKYGVVIEQDYQNGSPTGKPTAGVPITGLTMTDNTVGVTSAGTNTYILCASGACSGWKWSGNKISGGKKSAKCSGIPSGSGASC
jgi:polygalacturonase